MTLFTALMLTAAIYGLVKYVRHLVDLAYQQGYDGYHQEIEEEAIRIIQKIKKEQ